MSETFLTVADVAELLKLNQQTVRNWIDRGELRAVRVGQRRVRVKRSDLDRLIENGYTLQDPRVSGVPATPPLGVGSRELWARFGDASMALSEAIGHDDREELAKAFGEVAAAANALADTAADGDE